METAIITLRTKLELKQKLDMLALEDNRSLNNLIETILMKYVEEQEKNGKNI